MKFINFSCFCILILFSSAAISKGDGKQEIEQLANATESLHRSIRSKMIVQKYYFLHPPSNVNDHSIEELESRFDAADTAVFYSHDEKIADELVEIYNALRARGKERPGDRSSLAGAQIISRNFSSLGKMSTFESFPDEYHVPDIENEISDDQARWQLLKPSNNKLIRTTHSIEKGKSVIVISNPLCGFSNAASKAIESNADLSEFFSKYSLWLVPPTRRLYFKEITAWNSNYPSQKMALAYKTENWPIIDDWSTPIFYFIENGEVVDKVIGWPKDGGNVSKLRNAITRFSSDF